MSTVDESPQRRTPFSAKLPQKPLSEAIPVAETLDALAAPATSAVIAQHMGASSSSSGFKTKLAASGYYGLTTLDGDRRTLTDRGAAIVSGDADRVQAAKAEAVMSTTFGPILFSLRSRMANEAIVSSRLQGDYGVPPASADHVAGVLIESAKEAGLLSEGKFDAVAIEAHESVLPSTTTATAAATATTNGSTTTPASTPKKEPSKKRSAAGAQANTTEKNSTEVTPPFVTAVQVVINVDASKLSAQEIAELVKALQSPPAS
jgi:hypothetical protein